MRWIEGLKLNEYIYQHKSDKDILKKKLAGDFITMCKKLHEKSIAHGDLQHGNILVDSNGNIYLIDYDSMFVPSLEKERDIIKGKDDYQHPNRKANKYANCKLDYFSELIIYISILAISEKSLHWQISTTLKMQKGSCSKRRFCRYNRFLYIQRHKQFVSTTKIFSRYSCMVFETGRYT